MKNDALLELLTTSFDDARLDREEKTQMQSAFEHLSDEQRSFVRNRAFDMVTEHARNHQCEKELIWLSKVVKTIDASRPSAPTNRCYFSPGDECLNALLDQLQRATRSVDVCLFTISDNRIAQALKSAHQRAVKVRILTDNDKQYDLGSDVRELEGYGIDVRTDRSDHHMHHKFSVIDDRILITGSFNWTRSASVYNHENLMIIYDQHSIECFKTEFENLWQSFGEKL